MAAVSHIVIVGAGFGGCSLAQFLSPAVDAGHARVTIIEAGDSFMIGAACQYCLTDRIAPEALARRLRDLQGVSPKILGDMRLNTRVVSIDLAARTVTARANLAAAEGGGGGWDVVSASGNDGTTTLAYDYLVLATGSSYFPERIPGYASAFHNICKLDRVVALRDRVLHGVRATDDGETTFTVLVTIGGLPYKCPPSPFEVAFLLDELVQQCAGGAALRRAPGGAAQCRVRIKIASPKAPFPFGPPHVHRVFIEACKARNVEFLAGWQLTEVVADDCGPGGVAVFANGERIAYDVLAGTAPQAPPACVSSLPVADAKGYVPADLHTLRVDAPGTRVDDGACAVFCIGDAASLTLPRPGGPKPHPKAGHFAYECAKSVAKLLTRLVAPVPRGGARPSVASLAQPGAGVLPTERRGSCFAECGFGTAVELKPVLFSADAGPSFKCAPPNAEAYAEKVKWIDAHYRRLFGDDAGFSVSE